MGYFLAIIGWVLGLFLWSSVIGSLVATLPLRIRLKKAGYIKSIKWSVIIAPILISGLILLIGSVYSSAFFLGSSIAGIIIMFRTGNLKDEALESYKASDEYNSTEQEQIPKEDDLRSTKKAGSKKSSREGEAEDLEDWEDIKMRRK